MMVIARRQSAARRVKRHTGSPALVTALVVVLVLVASAERALAYIEPGVGSYILHVVIGTIAAVGFGIKLFWGRIGQVARRLFSRNAGDGGPGA